SHSMRCLNFLGYVYSFGGKLLWMPQHDGLEGHVFETQRDGISITHRVTFAPHRALNGFLDAPTFDHWADARGRIILASQPLCLGVLVGVNACPALALHYATDSARGGHQVKRTLVGCCR